MNAHVPAEKPKALYGCSFLRKLLHCKPVAHGMARILGPRRCGRLIGRLLLPYVREGAVNVLAVSRELLSKDIEQVEARTDINFIPWRSGHLGRMMEVWTPKVCQIQTNCVPDESYMDHPCWSNGVTLLKELVSVLEEKAPVPVAMTANVDYWQEEPLRRFCTETGVKHLVLDRENHMVKDYRDLMRSEHENARHFKFEGYAAVFSERMKNLLVETTGCASEQVTVTGAPRMDVWLDKRPAVEKDTVTLLSFHTCLIEGMFDDAVDVYIEAARKHPNLKFVIKCKEGRGDYGRMEKRFVEAGAPINLRPEQHINMRDLMDRSKVIVGFNTLSLAEALLTDTPLIIPSWKVTENDKHLVMMDPDDVELAKEVHFPRSVDQFREQLEQALTATPQIDRELRLKLTNRYMMFTPGETASERVARLIHQLAVQ